jgi:glycosyltransferase involved in cell wall biosynthesis
LRILFVSLIPAYWGGSEVLWSEAAKALASRRHEVAAFFALYREHLSLDQLRSAGVRLHYGTPPPLRWWKRWTYRTRPRNVQFQRLLEKLRPDLVVFSQAAVRDGLAEMQQCRAVGQRYAVINQLVEPLHYGDETWRAIREGYAAAERLWFVSGENREAVADYLGSALENAQVIPNAFACEFACATSWPTDEEPTRLALVARLEPEQKGHDLMIDALADPRWRSRRVEVTFFGEGPAREALLARCQWRGLTHVSFAGAARNAAEIWPTQHAAVLPSRYEGQSLGMLETMLHGRPVIATPAGGTRGLVREGETGFLASGTDLAAWQAALERAWHRRADWRTLGENAARVVREHVWRNPGQEMAARVEQLVATQNRRTS